VTVRDLTIAHDRSRRLRCHPIRLTCHGLVVTNGVCVVYNGGVGSRAVVGGWEFSSEYKWKFDRETFRVLRTLT
jgi:hypothetical protein